MTPTHTEEYVDALKRLVLDMADSLESVTNCVEYPTFASAAEQMSRETMLADAYELVDEARKVKLS